MVVGDEGVKAAPRARARAAGWILVPVLEMMRIGGFELNFL